MAETPRTGDRVRVILDGIFIEDDTGRCLELADRETVGIPDAASVEVLERADDPSKDIEGTVRREEHRPDRGDPPGCSLWQATFTTDHRFRWLCTYSTARGNRGEYLDHDDVVGWPIIGAGPGTPAAEANPVPPAIVERVRELLGNGQFERAVQVVRGAVADMSLSAGKAFVEGLQERDAAVPRVRVPNEPHGLSLFVHRQVADLVAVGNAGAASLLLQETGMPADEANDYVKTLAGDVS